MQLKTLQLAIQRNCKQEKNGQRDVDTYMCIYIYVPIYIYQSNYLYLPI